MILSYLQWQIMPAMSAQVNQSISQSKGKRALLRSLKASLLDLFLLFTQVPVSGNSHGEIYYSIRAKK